jgi:DNA-binding transcriptional ArsR family regulator
VHTYSQEPLRALADPTRRAIFERLREGPLAVKDIASGLPISRPAVSQHLSVLRRSGLVSERRQGTRRLYRIEPDGINALRVYVESFWTAALQQFAEAAATSEGGERDDT